MDEELQREKQNQLEEEKRLYVATLSSLDSTIILTMLLVLLGGGEERCSIGCGAEL